MIGLLERRLDAVVYRAKFVPTPFAARQLVSHGHVKVNGRRVTVASYLVKEGDSIELTPKARDMALVIEASKSAERDVPDYVNADHNKMTAKFVRTPKLGDVPYAAQMQPQPRWWNSVPLNARFRLLKREQGPWMISAGFFFSAERSPAKCEAVRVRLRDKKGIPAMTYVLYGDKGSGAFSADVPLLAEAGAEL